MTSSIRILGLLVVGLALAREPVRAGPARAPALPPASMQKRWLFVWRNLRKPGEVDRMIALFPRAAKDGYNGVVFNGRIAAGKAPEIRAAAKKYGLDLYPTVMGNSRDPNNTEGLLAKDAPFVVRGNVARFVPDDGPLLRDPGFEGVKGDRLLGWSFQDDPGVTTFADHDVVHEGKTSLRMEHVSLNRYHHCRVNQRVTLIPHRQYRLSAWVRSEGLRGIDPKMEVLDGRTGRPISFETFATAPTQAWKEETIVFNSGDSTKAIVYLGTWSKGKGRLWWDDVQLSQIALVNVLRRGGCPVTVKGRDGTVYEEGKDYRRIVDPHLAIYRPYHPGPDITLLPGSRIRDGETLLVSWYHPAIIYRDRLTTCLSEPSVFKEWEGDVRRLNRLLHPRGFFMSHDEIRVANQCALCRSRHMTPGELLADNVHRCAAIIRKVRPDAEIYVWSDMFDPMHNAKASGYYLVNGSLLGSWKGLDPDVTVVNWYGRLMGRNSAFFAKLGLKQILAGYYDKDEDGSRIAKWIAATKDVPGVIGAMYTTWQRRYDAMDVWARKAWGGSAAQK